LLSPQGAALFSAVSFLEAASPSVSVFEPKPVRNLSERLNMSSKIYVGNLPYTIDDASLRQNFSEFGGVMSAKVMMDRDTGRSKGFAFVEMSSAEEAQAAITGLNGMSVGGRSIVVNISKPKEPSTGYGGGYRDNRSSY
jgi:RNA recognition motif-containing protein